MRYNMFLPINMVRVVDFAAGLVKINEYKSYSKDNHKNIPVKTNIFWLKGSKKIEKFVWNHFGFSQSSGSYSTA